MRWQEILILSESDSNKDLRDELTVIFSILQVKNISKIPLEKLFDQLSSNEVNFDFEDDSAKKKVIDIITSMNNIIEKVENDIVYMKGNKTPDYTPTKDKEEKDSKEVKVNATKQATKNIKKGK